jgi:UMF1 family MFS transporter
MTAAFVMVFATIPLLVFVRERPNKRSLNEGSSAPKLYPIQQLRKSISSTRQTPGVVRLLGARFLYADAVGTLNIYMVVYITRLGDFTEREKNVAVGLGVICAGLGAALAGWQSSRRGPRIVLLTTLPLLAATLIVVAAVGQPWTIWLMAPTIGASLGTVYAADRVFMLRLTPESLRGQLFGIFNVIGRAAQALGPFLLWGSVIWLLHSRTGWLTALDASRVSICLLAISVIAGAAILRPLSDQPRSTSNQS